MLIQTFKKRIFRIVGTGWYPEEMVKCPQPMIGLNIVKLTVGQELSLTVSAARAKRDQVEVTR
jgi:hypothetical protein